MITGVYGSVISSYLTLEEKRIDTAVDASKVKYLFKFTNDMTAAVKYCYGKKYTTNDRYVKNTFTHNTSEDVFTYKINFKPYGFWKYEVYEVSWIGTVALTKSTAPSTETDVLTVDNDNGVVEGLVEIGKLYLGEKDGSEEVQYTQNAKRVQTLQIVSGGTGYAVAPTITIAAPTATSGYQATATCTILAGVVNPVTITYAGSGYTTIPVVTLTGGGFTKAASITATIDETNYIYYGQ